MKRAIVIGLAAVGALSLTGAEAHTTVHRETVTVQGQWFCPEDERLVPVKHHGYKPERTGGWVYTCKPFDSKGQFAK